MHPQIPVILHKLIPFPSSPAVSSGLTGQYKSSILAINYLYDIRRFNIELIEYLIRYDTEKVYRNTGNVPSLGIV